MKRINFPTLALGLCATLLTMAGCGEKDLYDPNYGKNELPPLDECFGFETRADMSLSVNYNAPGFKALIEVYAEDPIEKNTGKKKANIAPIFAAYTDANGKFDGKMHSIPTYVKELYLYTNKWGLPQSVKLISTGNGFSYNATASASTRAGGILLSDVFKNTDITAAAPYDFGYLAKYGIDMMSLCIWDVNGKIGKADTGKDYLSITADYKGEKVGEISTRIQSCFDATSNKSQFLSDAAVTNITTKEDGTVLDVIFLTERAAYTNTFGYYYYKKGTQPTRDELFKLKKYIVFPNITQDSRMVLPTGSTASLQFFGEKHDQPATKEFPKDYVIGWFYISNGYNEYYASIREGMPTLYQPNTIFFSDDIKNSASEDYRRFVSLDDKKSGLLVLGFEDQVIVNSSAEDYSDVLFFVKSNKDISEEDRPVVPDEKPEVPDGVETVEGTLAFEDGWPTGKDFDLNDVVVEYKRTITFDQENYAKSVKETFKFVQREGAANLDSYFAYQVEEMGTVATRPDNSNVENATKSIVFTSSAKLVIGQEFTVERTFAESTVTKEAVKTDFNPYIIVDNLKESNRIEVHLPKHTATSAADPRLISIKDDVYYMDKSGKFPFAIDIPVWGFEQSPERISVSETYKNFDSWVNSGGTEYTDWYKK